MATLTEAFAKIEADKALAQRFTKEPEAVLKELGVETKNLVIQRGTEGSFLTTGNKMSSRMTICGSVGFVVCVSAGDEVRI